MSKTHDQDGDAEENEGESFVETARRVRDKERDVLDALAN